MHASSQRGATLGGRLRDAVRRLIVAHGVFDDSRRPCGEALSLPHAWTLLELQGAEQALTVSELASKLAIDRTNVSRLCQRLEALGEVRRQPSPDDARATKVELTSAGQRAARRVGARSEQHFGELAGVLGGATQQVLDALELLEQAMQSELELLEQAMQREGAQP